MLHDSADSAERERESVFDFMTFGLMGLKFNQFEREAINGNIFGLFIGLLV